MTERLADVSARIAGVQQLGAVVNAMKGIAAAHARTARAQIEPVDSYAATIAAAISSALAGHNAMAPEPDPLVKKTGLVIFLAEQGFAGAFSERILDSLDQNDLAATLFVIGTRGLSVVQSRGLVPDWTSAMPSHSAGIPKLADQITTALYAALEAGTITRFAFVHGSWQSGEPKTLHQALFPLNLPPVGQTSAQRPLIQLPLPNLLASLGADYIHAMLCKAGLHAFAAENEARMQAMTSASNQITREIATLEATLRRVRQEAITAEIIELSSGKTQIRR